MEAAHLPSDATVEDVVGALRRDGYAIVDELVPNALMDRIAEEMEPFIQASPYGNDGFTGRQTKRTGAMIARSPASRELIMNPLAIGTTAKFLEKATTFQLHLTQVISVYGGSPAQVLHRDQVAWDFFPFPRDYEVQCNLIWAMTDFTAENGATRVVPGSHLLDDKSYTEADAVPAAMKRGSALFYTGKVYHGAGANQSNGVRQAINITYAVGWVRQEENQYLTTPLELARTLPDDLLKVMGYQLGCFAMGYVRDFEDPLTVLRNPDKREVFTIDIVKKAAEHRDAATMLLDGITN